MPPRFFITPQKSEPNVELNLKLNNKKLDEAPLGSNPGDLRQGDGQGR